VLLHNTFHKSEVLVRKIKKMLASLAVVNGAVMPSSCFSLCAWINYYHRQKCFSSKTKRTLNDSCTLLRGVSEERGTRKG
jgi:hypothetical protein